MLQLTKRTEYGLIALVHMADCGAFPGSGSPRDARAPSTPAPRRASAVEPVVVSVREIGERYPIPRRLLAEVLKDLSHAGLVESQRGAAGGYSLARSPDVMTLAEIVTALEGSPALTSCEGQEAAHDTCDVVAVCPIRSPLSRIRIGIWDLMERTTLRSLLRSSAPVALATTGSRDMHGEPARDGSHPAPRVPHPNRT